MQLTVHGTIVSPWVRRLMIALEEKALSYDLVNVVPGGNPAPEFLRISPLGKIPVLEVDGAFLPDSLAGCVFLDAQLPQPALIPAESWDRGWVFWLCDYLGTGLFAKVEAPLFIQRFANPVFFKKPTDESVIETALAAMPMHYDYLEAQLAKGPYLLGAEYTLADVTAGSIFVNLRHAGEMVDAKRWPRLAAYVARVHGRASFERIFERERDLFGDASPLFAA